MKPLSPTDKPGRCEPLDPGGGQETEEVADVFVARLEDSIGSLRTEELGPQRVRAERQEDGGGQGEGGHGVSGSLPEGGAVPAVHRGQQSQTDEGEQGGAGQHFLAGDQLRGGQHAERRPHQPAWLPVTDEQIVEGNEDEWRNRGDDHMRVAEGVGHHGRRESV